MDSAHDFHDFASEIDPVASLSQVVNRPPAAFSLLGRRGHVCASARRPPRERQNRETRSELLEWAAGGRLLSRRTSLGSRRQRITNAPVQETPRRVPTSSRPVALSATPSRLVAVTRSALLSTASSAARPAPSTASPTPTPTSRRASPGTRTPSSTTLRTPRSTSPAPRWRSVVSRRTRTGTTSSPTSRSPPHKKLASWYCCCGMADGVGGVAVLLREKREGSFALDDRRHGHDYLVS